MAASVNNVVTTAMRSAGSAFEGYESQCMSILQSLEQSMSVLTAGWTGQASQVFDQVMQQWSEDYNKIVMNLQAIKDTLMGSAVNYESVEGMNHDLAGQLRSALAGTAIPIK